tara:strand:+ start:609 stop:9818 length:9210 start_codon:yes stop_codon:yes gene_type:complete
MASRKKILLPRSDIPNRAPTVNEIDFGEIAVNTHDGKAFIKRQANGEVTIQSIGSEEVDNVYYVSKSGDYGNDGRSLMNSFKSLDSAVATVLQKQGFKFDEATCERDLHLIMDAVRYDMILNTNFNSVTAGQAYKRGNAGKVTGEQKYQTRRSINEERVGMLSAPLVASNPIAAARVGAGFTELIDIFYDGEPDDLYFENPPIEAQTDSNAAALILQDNKSAIQDAVLSYLNTAYITPYDRVKCSRDVGLILDAVADDLVTGSNYATTTAGWAYKRANSAYVLSDQNAITVAAINYARGLTQSLVAVTSDATVANLFLNVTNVIDGTQATYPAISYPTEAGATYQTADRITASAAIQTNRATLISDTTAYINENFTGIGVTCERDLGLIIDAVSRDLLLDDGAGTQSDFWSKTAGNAYLRANSAYVLSDQVEKTVGVINYARDLIKALPGVTSTTRIDTLFKAVTDVVDGTITSLQQPASFPVVGTYANVAGRAAQSAGLLANKASLISSVTTFIGTVFNTLLYDVAKCERDTGFLIDALSVDLLYGGNTASRQVAFSYFVGAASQLGGAEGGPTVAAFSDLADNIKALVTSTEDARIDELIDITTDAIIAGNIDSVPAEIEISTAGLTTTEWDAINTAQATVTADTLTYGRTRYSFYDQDACARDVGYIVDGISYDLKYGGNTATIINAEAYFVGTVSQLGSDEVAATVAAYNDLKVRINDYVTTTPEQDVKDTFIDAITGVITAGNISGLAAKVNIDLDGLNAGLVIERAAIIASKGDTQADVLVYVDDNWAVKTTNIASYDAGKCSRDVGLILDAVRRDFLLGTDYWTVTAGNSYLRANSAYVLSDQNFATTSAINYAATLIKQLQTVDAGAGTSDVFSTDDKTALDVLFKRVTDCIDGTITTPQNHVDADLTSDYSNVAGRSPNFDAVEINKASLISSLTSYIGTNYPALVYDSAKCERDAGFLIDAINIDLLYGGNSASRQAAMSYFVGATSQLGTGEAPATIAAFNDLRDNIKALITGAAEDARVDELMYLVTFVIDSGDTVSLLTNEEEPSTLGLTTTQYDAILEATADTKQDVIEYVNKNFKSENPDYDQLKCYRDVGLILDAVRRDLLLGTDYNTITAGFAYKRANSAYVQSDQLVNTLKGIRYARDEVKKLVSASDTDIDVLFARVTDVLEGYVTTYTTPTFNNPGGTFQSTEGGIRPSVVASIQAVRGVLINDMIVEIDRVNPNLQYNSDKCRRDAGYIIDAFCHDILYSGNTASRQNAASYYVGAASQLGAAESATTVLAYEYLLSSIIDPLTAYTQSNVAINDELTILTAIITNVINAGNLDNLATEIDVNGNGLVTTDYNAIRDNTLQIQDDTISFVNDLFFNVAYDQDKCARDVGLIVDAIALEYITRSTAPSSLVALSYRRPQAQEVYGKQRAATLAAINYLEDLLSGLVDTAGGNELTLVAPFQRIRDGLNAGPYTSGVDRTWIAPNTSLYNGTEGGVDNTGSTANTISAQNALNTFSGAFVTNVLDYVNNTLGVTSFDNQTCGEDIVFILNALAYDVDTGTNWSIRQVTEAYFVGVVNQLGNDSAEVEATILAYERLKGLITQDLPLYATLGSQEASIIAYINAEIDILINAIKANSTANMPALVYPSTVGENATDIIGFNTCVNNRTILQNNVVDFVNDSNPVNSFDDEKCARDTGYIIDAILVDLEHNTNYNSITAGLAYQRGNADKVQSDQLKYTVQSINYLRDLINGLSISVDSKAFVTARIKEVTELLTQGTDFGTVDGTPIDYTGRGLADRFQVDAANAIKSNRRNLQKAITNWIQINYDTFEYDPDKCERDVGYIVDGIVHDMLFQTGNSNGVAARNIARSYWVGRDLNIEGNANQAENLDGVADVWANQLGQDEVNVTGFAYAQLGVFIKGLISTTAEKDRVDALLLQITDSIAAADPSGLSTAEQTLSNADAQSISTSKTEFTNDVVRFANKVFPVSSYNQAKCRRDVGFVIDALTYDIKYGGNSATSIAMRSYFSIFNNGYGDLLGDNEYTMTIAAYMHLKNTILRQYFAGLEAGVKDTKNALLDILLNAIAQTTAGTFQIGTFFGADKSLDVYQYNYPTGLAAGYNVQTFPDLITLGHKVVFNKLYNAHQEFNVGESQRLTIIRSSNAVAKNQGTDSTIFLKSGDYIVNNPIKLPPKTSIIGDALRSTTIRPKNVDSDIFWADNGVYIKEITFRDHQDGAACLAFDPRVDSPGAGPFITQSPYVQNCTSLTSSGTGLRIDGSKVSGLRSMVLDAFTQFNAGGIGVHLLNRGYSQLVSLFTVSTTTSVLATSGGQCSLTNSNSSFGERGLVATGGSPSLYNGSLHANYITNDNVIRINTITTQDSADYTLNIGDYKKPNYNDAIRFDSDNYYYTVLDVSKELTQDWATTGNTTENVQGVFDSAIPSFPQQTLTTNGQFGYSTHMSQNDLYLVVTEPNDGAGKAEIYLKDFVGGIPQWDYQAQVVPTPVAPGVVDANTDFGAVALLNATGDFLAVSAPAQQKVDATNSTNRNGAVYMYERTGTTWGQHSVVFLPGVTDRDRKFGGSMDLSEDGLTLVVTTDNDTGPNTQGAGYFYLRTSVLSSTWTMQQRIGFPDGSGIQTTQPDVTVSADGQDLILQWGGAINKAYYFQRNIDNVFILAQQVFPRSNFFQSRDPMIRMNPTATHFVMGDTLTHRGYITNALTDSDNGAPFYVARKQKLDNAVFSNSPAKITSTDTDRWLNFENDFAIGSVITIEGAGANDGDFSVSAVAQDSVQFSGTFAALGALTDVQMYVKNVGVAEFFVFEEGQWVTEDIIQAPFDAEVGFGFGAGVDLNLRGELASIGNKSTGNLQKSEVSIIERARSDWRRVTRLEPVTPTNIVTKGSNDGYGSRDKSTAATVGGTGDFIVVGAPDRRQDDANSATEYGAVFSYYSILEETGSYELTVAPALNKNLRSLQNASFHQRSLITASGHTFEYVGSGTNMFTAIPQNGGVPKKENEVIFDSADAFTPNFGLVYFTATDELGDFRIGEDLTINREEGTITGVTFDRSLFAVLTPFILALEG